MYTDHCTVYSVMYTDHCTVYSVMYTDHCTVYSVMYTDHCTVYTIDRALYTKPVRLSNILLKIEVSFII